MTTQYVGSKVFNQEEHVGCPRCKCELLFLDGEQGRCYYLFYNGQIDPNAWFIDDAPAQEEHNKVQCNHRSCGYTASYEDYLNERHIYNGLNPHEIESLLNALPPLRQEPITVRVNGYSIARRLDGQNFDVWYQGNWRGFANAHFIGSMIG